MGLIHLSITKFINQPAAATIFSLFILAKMVKVSHFLKAQFFHICNQSYYLSFFLFYTPYIYITTLFISINIVPFFVL